MRVPNLCRFVGFAASVSIGATLSSCASVTPDRSFESNEKVGVRLLVRFAIDDAFRYPNGVYYRLVEDGELEFRDGYFPPQIPSGPIEMDCTVVDSFGASFHFTGMERNRYPRKNVEVTLSHPELDGRGWKFLRRVLPPYRHEVRPTIQTYRFEMEDRYRRDGVYTLDVTYKGETLLQVYFNMMGCEAET